MELVETVVTGTTEAVMEGVVRGGLQAAILTEALPAATGQRVVVDGRWLRPSHPSLQMYSMQRVLGSQSSNG